MSRSQRIRQAYISTGATAGLILAGMAPAALFGYSLYAALVADGWLPQAAFVPGFSLAVTMEVVGSVSAHVAQHYPQRRKLATAALVTYTLIGLVYMLFFEPDPVVQRAGVMAYLCAPLLYVSVALLSAMERERETAQVTAQTAVQRRAERAAWEREQEAADRELARQLKLQRQADNTAVKLAKVQNVARNNRQDTRRDGGMLPADWRQLSRQQVHDLAHATRDERERVFPDLAGRTRREWHRRLDEVAAQNGKS